MASYNGAHAYEGMLPRNATAVAFANSSGAPRDIHAQRQSESSVSNSHFDSSFPHAFSPSNALSTSVVREQSLALGNLELAQSFGSNPTSPVVPHHHDNNSNSGTSAAASGLGRIDRQSHPSPKDKKNNGNHDSGDRSPPSGLSLLLKTNDHSKTGTGSNHDPMASLGSGTVTGSGSVTTSPKHERNTDNTDVERALTSRVKHGNAGNADAASSIAPSSSPLVVDTSGSTVQGSSRSETDHLLPRHHPEQHNSTKGNHNYNTIASAEEHGRQKPLYDDGSLRSMYAELRHTKWTRELVWDKCVAAPVSYLPAVVLGLLLNLLDAVSYGMITFPLNVAPFQDLGPDGISMFFVSCVVSQLVYSLGGSAFKGGNGSMMIEVVPFLHLMAETIVERVGAENRDAVLATTILAYALSTIMTGLVFMALGYFKLGSLVAFFPRHILVGCIGGVGWFLIITGLEVSSRMTTGLTYSLETFKFLFMDPHVFALWFSALFLALFLRVLQYKFNHPFLVPGFYIIVPAFLYTLRAIVGWEWEMLRENGWVFPMPGKVPGWQFYTYFDLKKTDWGAILDTVPAMLALTFFGILHVPINVPALGVSTKRDDIDTNRELVAHGWSNLLSGGVGSVQNYLAYTNSLLFINSGGDSRVAGVMLALATLAVFFIGPWIVGYIPVMVVGSLIFHLGLDLVKEALWDTWGRVHYVEYVTIALIVVSMAGLGFVEGVVLGLLLACVIFVWINSRREGVRYSVTGKSARSTVRRIYRQQKFLRTVGHQIHVFKLQGDMFFGTIDKVEKKIRDVLSPQRWENNRIRYLVLDFSLVRYVDFSAAEVFRRIREAVNAKEVHLVLCGLDEKGEVGMALQMVGVWGTNSGSEGKDFEHAAASIKDAFDTTSFAGLSEALEYCENGLLETIYGTTEQSDDHRRGFVDTTHQDDNALSPTSESTRFFADIHHSPRKKQIFEAASDTIHVFKRPRPFLANHNGPPPTIFAAFYDTSENSTDSILRLGTYLERKEVPARTVLWKQGDPPTDGIYLVEKGILRSTQEFNDSDNPDGAGMIRYSVEAILPSTISGEIGLFTGNARTSTLVAETNSVLWGLNQERFQKMIKEDPTLAIEFMRLSMSFSAERLNTMTAYAFNLS